MSNGGLIKGGLMSLINRYKFVKKMYPEVLCLYQEKQKITSCEQDLDIFIYLQKDLKTIKKKEYHTFCLIT